MRLILVLFLTLPLAAQQAAQPAKPETAPAAKEAKSEAAEAEKQAESPAPAAEQWLSGSVDFGYRWRTDIGGHPESYRSVVNLGEGPKLFGLDVTLQDPKKRLFDRLDARAQGWGGEPYSTARLDARKSGIYDFTFDYRDMAYYNNLPSFADPLMNVSRGFFFNERSFDTRRRMSNLDLMLFPGKRIVPYFAFGRDAGRGSGVSTYVSGGNEYALPDLFSDRANTFRGGVRLEFRRWHLTLEEGGTVYDDEQRVLPPAAVNLGNRSAVFTDLAGVSRQLQITSAGQTYAVSSRGPYSKVLATGNPFPWLDLYGRFVYSQPKTEANFSEQASGNLVLLSSLLFYNGQLDVLNGASKRPHTSAGAGFEARPIRRLRILESWMTDRYHNAAATVLTEQLLFGSTTRTLASPLDTRLILNYNRQQVDVLFDVTRRFTLRGGHRYVWGDSAYTASPLSQAGPFTAASLSQHVGLAGFTYRAARKLTFSTDFEAATSSRTYFRTSLRDYQQARIRARYQALANLSLAANVRVLSNQNPTPGIQYDFMSRDASLSVNWTPKGGKRITVLGEYSRSTLDSDINYLAPQMLSPERSFYRDHSHTAAAMIDISLPACAGVAPRLSLGGTMFAGSGSRPSRYYQPQMRLSVPVRNHVHWNTEWRWYGLSEAFYLYEGFRTHVFSTGLRLSM